MPGSPQRVFRRLVESEPRAEIPSEVGGATDPRVLSGPRVPPRKAQVAAWEAAKLLLQAARNAGERIVCVAPDQTQSADDQHKNYGKHHSVLRNVLTIITPPESLNLRHDAPPKAVQRTLRR